jgi:hypothetical protein
MARALHSPRKPDVRECVHCAVRVVYSTLGSGRVAGAAQGPLPMTARLERAHSVWSAPGRGARRGWRAYPIKSKLVYVGKSERAISVSGYIKRGCVKIARSAYDKVSVYKGRRTGVQRLAQGRGEPIWRTGARGSAATAVPS